MIFSKAVSSKRAGTLQTALMIGLIPVVVAGAITFGNPMRVVVALLAFLVVVLILARPFWGLLCFVGLIYVRPEDALPELAGMQLTLLTSVVMLAGACIQMFQQRQQAVRSPVLWLMVGFGAMTVVSTIAGGNPIQAAQDNAKLVLLLILTLNLVRTLAHYRVFCNTLVLFTGYLAISTIYLFYTGVALVENEGNRAIGIGAFGNPNDVAACVIPGIPLALLRTTEPNARYRWFWTILAGMMVWSVYLTQSRGGMLALLVAGGGFILLQQGDKRRAVLIAGAACAVFIVLASSGRMLNIDNKEASANSRVEYWGNGIIMFANHPLTGIGYTQFPVLNGTNAHNMLVICFAELGLPGYFCWMGCLYYCYRRRTQGETMDLLDETSKRELQVARLALSCCLTAGFFGNYTYFPPFYILLSLPLTLQIAASGRDTLFVLSPKERFHDFLWIGGICLASILGIRLIVPVLM